MPLAWEANVQNLGGPSDVQMAAGSEDMLAASYLPNHMRQYVLRANDKNIHKYINKTKDYVGALGKRLVEVNREILRLSKKKEELEALLYYNRMDKDVNEWSRRSRREAKQVADNKRRMAGRTGRGAEDDDEYFYDDGTAPRCCMPQKPRQDYFDPRATDGALREELGAITTQRRAYNEQLRKIQDALQTLRAARESLEKEKKSFDDILQFTTPPRVSKDKHRYNMAPNVGLNKAGNYNINMAASMPENSSYIPSKLNRCCHKPTTQEPIPPFWDLSSATPGSKKSKYTNKSGDGPVEAWPQNVADSLNNAEAAHNQAIRLLADTEANINHVKNLGDGARKTMTAMLRRTIKAAKEKEGSIADRVVEARLKRNKALRYICRNLTAYGQAEYPKYYQHAVTSMKHERPLVEAYVKHTYGDNMDEPEVTQLIAGMLGNGVDSYMRYADQKTQEYLDAKTDLRRLVGSTRTDKNVLLVRNQFQNKGYNKFTMPEHVVL